MSSRTPTMTSAGRARGRVEAGFTLLEVALVMAIMSLVVFGILEVLGDGVDAQSQQAQVYQVRNHARASLRRMGRELEQSSIGSPSFSTTPSGGSGISFNLPATIGDEPTWGPTVTYRVRTDGFLVREQSGSSQTLMGECVSLVSTRVGQKVTLTLTAEGDGYPEPRFAERLVVILIPQQEE